MASVSWGDALYTEVGTKMDQKNPNEPKKTHQNGPQQVAVNAKVAPPPKPQAPRWPAGDPVGR